MVRCPIIDAQLSRSNGATGGKTLIEQLVQGATVIAAVGCGLMAGLFFSFSVVIMRALGRLPPPQGMLAMRSINETILNPVFFLLFFGTTGATLVLAVAAPFAADSGAAWLVVGGGLYLLGAFLVTVVRNVPLNNALAAAEPAGSEGDLLWGRYLVHWTAWNHVRTLTSLAAAVILTLRV